MITRLVENHVAYTDSERASELLENWDEAVSDFVRVLPDAYAEIIAEGERHDVRSELPEAATPTADGVDTDFAAQSDD